MKNKRFFSLLLALVLAAGLVLETGLVKAKAAGNIIICGVDIGIEAGSYMQFYDKYGNKSSTGKYYNGYYLGASQCFGFARWCQYRLFGYTKMDKGYNNAFYNVSVNGVTSIPAGQLNVSNLKAMIAASKPGAHLRTFPKPSGHGHSMIITEITETGFSIAHANGQPNNEYPKYQKNYVGTYTFTWESYLQNDGKYGIDYIELPINYPEEFPKTPPINMDCIGSLDEVTIDRGRGIMTVRGWSADPDDYSQPVDTHILIGNLTLKHELANKEHKGAHAELGIGENHGFQFDCPIPENLTGIQTVEAHGIDLETGINYLFDSQQVDFSLPYGVLEEVIVDNNKLLVRGWAKDPDDPNRAVDVHMVIVHEGKHYTLGHAPANQYSAATGSRHGFQFDCPIPENLTGIQTVEAHGIDLEYDTNFQFDSKTITLPGSCSCSPSFKGSYVTMAPVKIYSGHNHNFSVLGTIPTGTVIQISKARGLNPEHFGHVTYNGISGYVSMEQVRMNLGDDFYGYIILQEPWRHLTNDLPNVSLRQGTGQQNQVWHFRRQTDGSYKITSVVDGTVLTVENASGAAGANVLSRENQGSNSQSWLIGGAQSQYILSSKCGATVLEVGDTAYPDGTNVAMNKFTGKHNQRFHIWKLENYTPAAPPYPQISFSASKYGMAEGQYMYQEPITVSWAAANTASYWLQIKNNSDGSYIINQMVTDNTYTFLPPDIGTFTVAMRAYNETGDSGRIDRTLTVNGLTGRIWASETAQGPQQTEFPLGRVFLNFSLTNPLTQEPLYDYLKNYPTQVTLTLADASGKVLLTQSYENEDGAAFSYDFTKEGTYTLTVKSNRQSVFYTSTITLTVAGCRHDYTEAVTPPTCTEQGFTTHTCSICAESYVDSYVDTLGHIPGQDAVCERCGEVIDQPDVDHIPGDITGDTVVNNKDLLRLFRYLSSYDVEVDLEALDVNGDGQVNNKDLTRLFRYLSGHDVVIY